MNRFCKLRYGLCLALITFLVGGNLWGAPKAKPKAKDEDEPKTPSVVEIPSILDDGDLNSISLLFSKLSENQTDNLDCLDIEKQTRNAPPVRQIMGVSEEFRSRMNQRRPKADERMKLAEACYQASEQISVAQENIGSLSYQISDCEGQLALSTGQAAAQLRSVINQCQGSISRLNGNINTLEKKINSNVTRIGALNQQIHPYDVELRRLWLDATDLRKQWVDVVNPMGKITRGDFAELRTHLDDWTKLDTVWPGAYLWASLCAFEQGDQERADNYARMAGAAFQELYGPWKKWSQGEALAGLILSKSRADSTKAEKLLGKARRHANKETDWESYFFVGVAYANKKDYGRAKANFKTALEIAPNNIYVKAWNARVQIRAADAEDNIDTELERLEAYWNASKPISWQIGIFLSEAYIKSNKADKAKEVLVEALQRVPRDKQKSVKEEYEAFQKSLTSAKRKANQKKSG